MKNLWMNSLILLVWATLSLPTPLVAQEDLPADVDLLSESNPDLGRLKAELTYFMEVLRAYQPDKVLDELQGAGLPPFLKDMLEGWALHQKGNYLAAEEAFNRVNLEELERDGYLSNRIDELAKTAARLKHFVVVETDNFSIRYEEGRDGVLAHHLPEVLEQTYRELSKIFNYKRDEKIIVEIMPNHELFSYASALTKSQIETTGTIALCVENRLVMLAPRRVLTGYYWPEIIAHEFVHYVLNKISEDRVPLWMQEGVAKYLESLWTGQLEKALSPGMEHSLAVALKNDALISIEDMYPSFAALPTAELARQAYAQTASMVGYIHQQKGLDAIRQIAYDLREKEMDQVMQATFQQDFNGFLASWKQWAGTAGYKEHGQAQEAEGVQLLDEDNTNQDPIAELPQDAKDLELKYIRLGDLLLQGDRFAAALKQYRKHIGTKTKIDRAMMLRLITCYRHLNRFADIEALIRAQIPDLKRDPNMLVNLADALVQQNRPQEAREYLNEAIYNNPYNPMIYNVLVRLEEEQGNKDAVLEAKQMLDLLRIRSSQQSEGGQGAKKDIKS